MRVAQTCPGGVAWHGCRADVFPWYSAGFKLCAASNRAHFVWQLLDELSKEQHMSLALLFVAFSLFQLLLHASCRRNEVPVDLTWSLYIEVQ